MIKKISKIIILCIFSLYPFSSMLEVKASQDSTVKVKGYLDENLELDTCESFKNDYKEEKQTVLIEKSLPNTGENTSLNSLILGCMLIFVSVLIFFLKRKTKI